MIIGDFPKHSLEMYLSEVCKAIMISLTLYMQW